MSIFQPKSIVLGDGAELTLRSPSPAEAGELLDYLDAVRRESDGILFSPEDPLMSEQGERDWVRDHRADPRAVLLAAVAGDEFVALCGVHPTRFARQRHTAGVGISVRSAWCGRGLGTRLMRELIGWAETNTELEQLTLNVFETNPRARALYRKVGFVEDGRLPRRVKIDGAYVGIVEMSRWLDRARVAS